jgi:hypothetical protein
MSFIELEVSQELTNGPNVETDESSSHIYHFFTINFNVFFTYIPKYSERFIPSGLCIKILYIIIIIIDNELNWIELLST